MQTIFLLLLAGFFLLIGTAKLLGAKSIVAGFAEMRLPNWSRYVIGTLEVLGALLLAASVVQPFFTFFAATFLFMICIGAVAAHWVRGPRKGWPVAAALGVGLVVAVLLQPVGLKVLLLPAADDLPVALLSSEVVTVFDEGTFVESVLVEPSGSIIMTRNTGLDIATGDTTNVRADVIKRDSVGNEEVLFTLPDRVVAGVLAQDPAGVIYMTSVGDQAGIWRVNPGAPELFARAPKGSWPNGLKFGPDGMLYVADSALGTVWRVNPADGSFSQVIQDPKLLARRFVALAPGANGLEFFGQDIYVTVSDAGTLLKATLQGDGTFGELTTVATGVPADDIAINEAGDVYLATHPYNTVVELSPDGTRTVVADASTGATGSTDLSFVQPGSGDTTLYMVTDGGLFGGVADAAGSLVKLTVK